MTKRRLPLSAVYILGACLVPLAAISACCLSLGVNREPGPCKPNKSATPVPVDETPPTPGSVCEALAQDRPMDRLCPPDRIVGPCDQAPPCFALLDASEQGGGEEGGEEGGGGMADSEVSPGVGLFANHCVYAYDPNQPECEELGALTAAAQSGGDRDCRVQLSAPAPNDAGTLPTHSNHPSSLAFDDWLIREAHIEGLPPAKRQIRVSLLDDDGAHGQLMENIISGSPYDGMPPDIERRRVLASGGAFASDIALEIEAARQAWRAEAPDENLILNLSLAWERLETLDPGQWQSPMVHLALQRASCDGALIIAAGGNESPYACPAGPVEPALWTSEPRPSAQVCLEQFEVAVPDPAAWDSCEDCPLVYAVGAMDERGRDLPNHRADSRPLLATRGDSMTMSGTSISAAVTSGAAARLWSHAPELPASEIMAQLYAAGTERFGADNQALRADLCLGSNQPAQVQLQPCAALLSLLEQHDLLPPSAPGAPEDRLRCPSVWPNTKASLPTHIPAYSVEIPARALEQCPETPCNEVGPFTLPASLAAVAPDPWGRPQPISYPCPTCKVKGYADPALPNQDASQTTLELELDAAARAERFTGVLVTLWDAQGNEEHHFYSTTDLGKLDPTTNQVTPWKGQAIAVKDAGLFEITGADGSPRPPVEGWIEVRFSAGSEGNKLGGFTPSTSSSTAGSTSTGN